MARRACWGALGRAGLACWGAQGGRRTGAGGRVRAGERQLGAGASGRQGAGRAAGRWARGRVLGARQAGAGRARPGRLGWPWAVHSAHFRSILTRFFS